MRQQQEPDFQDLFPVGARVRVENEMWPGHWEYGVVRYHRLNRYGMLQWVGVQLDEWECATEIDYRYLDTDPHLSLVRLVKGE